MSNNDSFWGRNPRFFSSIVIFITSVLLIFTGINFFGVISSITDGNWYSLPSSVFYVKSDFPANCPETAAQKNPAQTHYKIQEGWLIQKVEDEIPVDSANFARLLSRHSDTSRITISVIPIPSLSIREYYTTKKDLLNNLTIFPCAAVVRDVFEGGASDRAGMKRGDIIIKVNGKNLNEVREETLRLQNQKSGSIISYEIFNKQGTKVLDVMLAKFGVTLASLTIFICGLLMIALGIYIIIKRSRLTAARLTGLSLLSMGFLLSYGFLVVPSLYSIFEIFHYITRFVLLLIGIPLLIHSLLYFPREAQELINKKWLIRVPYIMGFVALILTIWFFTKQSLNIIGMIITFVLSFFILYSVILSIVYRKSDRRESVKTGTLIRDSLYLNLILVIVVPFLKVAYPGAFWDYTYIAVILMPLSYIYTIARYRTLDLGVRIKKNIQFSFLSIGWIIVILGCYVTVTSLLAQIRFNIPNISFSRTTVELLRTPLPQEANLLYGKLLLILLSLVSAYLFWKIYRYVHNYISKKYFREKFDYKVAASQLSEVMESTFNLKDLSKGIVDKLGNLVHLKHVGIVIFKDGLVHEQNYFGYIDEKFNESCEYPGQKLIEPMKLIKPDLAIPEELKKNTCCADDLECQDAYRMVDRVIYQFCIESSREITEEISKFNGSIRIDYLPEPLKTIFKECWFQYIIPIRSKGNLVGALFIGEKMSETAIHNEDIDFLSSISSQAAVAIENAFLYENLAEQERIKHELSLARRIQLASLPQKVPNIAGLDISGISIPALEVGGDFYDFLNDSEHDLTVVVGDVSGKGTSAALHMSKAQGIMRTLHEFRLSPQQLLIRTNQLLYRYLDKSSFISAIGAKINTENKNIRFARAGHLPLIHYKNKTGKVEKITPKGIVLGLAKDDLFDDNLNEESINYEKGDIFLFITDGVLEARNLDLEEYGDDRLEELLLNNKDLNSTEIRDQVITSVREFSGQAEQYDDITVVVVKAA